MRHIFQDNNEEMTHHLIKKYPNRRLYDTLASKYITLTDLKHLIFAGACVKVVDSNTEEDLTRGIMLQIIIEAESSDDPMFSAQTLQQIIRFYGGTLQGIFAKYIEESLQLFTQQQSPMNNNFNIDPLSVMSKIAEQNMSAWSDMQNQFFGASPPPESKEEPKK